MAGYKTHITVSGLLGAGYGAAAVLAAGFSPIQGALAGCLTGVAGMLPDLDSDSGRPVQEVFGVTAALAPAVMMRRLMDWGGGTEGAALLAILLYALIRYGAASVLKLCTVHRGMYHSLPALFIAAELTFLGYQNEMIGVKLLMAAGVAIGFGSHLVLDEIYSVQWNGIRVKLKSSSGTAVKWFSPQWSSNILAYGLLFTLSYGALYDGGALQYFHSTTSPTVPLAQPAPPRGGEPQVSPGLVGPEDPAESIPVRRIALPDEEATLYRR